MESNGISNVCLINHEKPYNPWWKWRSTVNPLIYVEITIHSRNIAMSYG